MSPPRDRSGRPSRHQLGPKIPYLWIGTALIVVLVVGVIVLATRQAGPAAAGEVECHRNEYSTYHVHANLKIFVNGQNVPVNSQIGIRSDCLYWLHTHDGNGTIHVESPRAQAFTLGQFFKIWEKTLSPTEMMGYKVDADHQIKAYVDGQEYTGDPSQITLKSHSVITLEYGPPFVPPATYQFPPSE